MNAFLAVLLADVAAATPPAAPFPWDYITSGAGAAVISLLTWFVRSNVASKRLQDALLLLSTASATGVRVAWETYTKEKKAASADGSLTDEEIATARRKAFEAAAASIGAVGMKTLRAALKDGADDALHQALEAEYAHFRGGSAATAAGGETGAAPAGGAGGGNPPVPPGTPA